MQDRLVAYVCAVRAGEIEVPPSSVLALLLAEGERRGVQVSNLELATTLITLLAAGHDTTAVSFTWALQALARHPEVVARVRGELEEAGGFAAQTAASISALPYLNAVIKESMRLTPIAVGAPRTTLQPVRIGGVDLPADVGVLPLTFAVQHDRRFWEDPLVFDPARMLQARSRPETLFPFGGGYRRCVGAYFASLELRYLLAAFVERVQFEAVDPTSPMRHAASGIVTAPADEGPLTILRVRPPGGTGPGRPQRSSSLAR